MSKAYFDRDIVEFQVGKGEESQVSSEQWKRMSFDNMT
jgi:hypothetical protein